MTNWETDRFKYKMLQGSTWQKHHKNNESNLRTKID